MTTAAANRAADAFLAYFRELVTRRRSTPEDDLITSLLHAQGAGDGFFTDEDLLGLIVAVFAAGHGPGIAMIANTWLALLRHPSELMLLKEHPEWIVGAVEEGLRYDPPTQAPNPLAATSDVDVGGKIIRKGQPVRLIGAVNRDPAAFPEPERFDITRHPNRHLAFSGGAHYCLGATLARMEAQIALGALLRKLDHPALDCDPDELRWIPHDRFRTMEQLPISFQPVSWRSLRNGLRSQ